jgi:hypothetical protein
MSVLSNAVMVINRRKQEKPEGRRDSRRPVFSALMREGETENFTLSCQEIVQNPALNMAHISSTTEVRTAAMWV